MKMQGPAGTTSISVGGDTFNAGDDGLFELPDSGDYLPLLAPHGFVVVATEVAAPAPAPAPTDTPPADGSAEVAAPAPAARRSRA